VRRAVAAAAIASAAAIAGCGGSGAAPSPPADAELFVRVTAEAPGGTVDFGRAFPLEVVRAWREPLEPIPWDERALDPLVVRLVESERSETASHVVETRRYAAYAFERGEVVVAAPEIVARPRGGGRERRAAGAELRLDVRGALPDPAAPGEVEPPGDLRSEPFPWLLAAAAAGGAAAAAALAAIALARRRRAGPGEAPAPRGTTPAERALARLDALRSRAPRSRDEEAAFHLEAAALLRDYLAETRPTRATALTREEIVGSRAIGRALPAERLALLDSCLGECDLAVFARESNGAERRAALLDRARAFVAGDE
jgi:hypothetical protein